jgi:hypothetical protein
MPSKTEETIRRWYHALDQCESDSDRAVGLVGGALVESLLDEVLVAHTVQGETTTALLRSHIAPAGALGAFSLKIHLAHLMSLYSQTVYEDLKDIKEVRNRFAHRLEIDSFSHPEVKDRCLRLRLPERHAFDRNKYNLPQDLREILKTRDDTGYFVGLLDFDETMEDARKRFVLTVQILFNILISVGASPPQLFKHPF